ncbi:MAG: outer membrane lipoprotein-sorting protein [Prolixibacteraceae bacterium]|nr:outer membrane lipoprotein-sorting protein [Prolixibacteraceae bacterium]
MKKIALLLAMLLSCGWIIAQDARSISKKAENAINLKSMEMVSNLKIYNARGDERTRKITTVTRKFGDVTKMMIRFIEPADVKGTTLLVYDYEDRNDDMWIFMPALRKTRRIVSSEKGKYFMGTEFTNADMSKPNFDDFTYTLAGEEIVNRLSCWKIESSCKTAALENEYGYSKRIAFIEKENNLTQKIQYYNRAGELLRTQTISEYKLQSNDSYFAYHMKMENEQNGRSSVMAVDQLQIGSTLPEARFSPAMIEQ